MTQQAAPPITVRFLCLARNCAGTIPRFLHYLQQLEAVGILPSVLVGENGSSDGTRALLEAAAGERFALLDTSFMDGVPGRLTRMAMGRQALLESARTQASGEDFVCVADLDNVMLSPPAPSAVRAALDYLAPDSPYFAVGATSEPFYYDVLSLRAEGHDYSTLHTDIAAAKKKPATYFHFHKHRIYASQIRATTGEPVVCSSSFNGFCLYKARNYYLGSYRAPDEALVCEHVSLNQSLAQQTQGKMLVLPTLKVRMPDDHGPVGFWRFWADRMRKLA